MSKLLRPTVCVLCYTFMHLANKWRWCCWCCWVSLSVQKITQKAMDGLWWIYFDGLGIAKENKKKHGAHEMRDSITLISYAGCLGLSPVISEKIHSLNVRCSLKSRKNSQKKPYFTSFKVINLGIWYPWKARQQCLLWYTTSLCLSATVLVLD